MGLTLLQRVAHIFLRYQSGKERKTLKLELKLEQDLTDSERNIRARAGLWPEHKHKHTRIHTHVHTTWIWAVIFLGQFRAGSIRKNRGETCLLGEKGFCLGKSVFPLTDREWRAAGRG